MSPLRTTPWIFHTAERNHAISYITIFLSTFLSTVLSQVPTKDNICAGLPQPECQRQYEMTTGDTLCAYNIVLDECYPITRTQGLHGSGNFDDGFIYAKHETDATTIQARIILVVFGILSGLLLIALIIGAYYIWNWAPVIKRHLTEGTESSDEDNEKHKKDEEEDFLSRSSKCSLQIVDAQAKYSITATPIEVSGLTFASEGRIRSECSDLEEVI